MHVQSIKLHNVRQFSEREMSFRPGFNLLVGENGAGKTTLLRSLAVVLGANRHSKSRPSITDEDIRLRSNDLAIVALVSDQRTEPWTLVYQKKLWQRARPFGAKQDRLVLMYSCNESACNSFVSRKVKRYGASPEAEDLRRSEEFLFEAETPEFDRQDDEWGFGNSRKIRSFTARILSTFSERFHRFYWAFEPFDCSVLPP